MPAKKPNKPYDGFPLFAHSNGQWAKKIHGRLVYFGKWADGWQDALECFIDEQDRLFAGVPVLRGDGLTVQQLCNEFLSAKQSLLDAGDICLLYTSDAADE